MDFKEVYRKKAWQTTGLLEANNFTVEHHGKLMHTQLSASAGGLAHCTPLEQNCSWKLVPGEKCIPWISCLVQLNDQPCTYLCSAPRWVHAGVNYFQNWPGAHATVSGGFHVLQWSCKRETLVTCRKLLQQLTPFHNMSYWTEQWFRIGEVS